MCVCVSPQLLGFPVQVMGLLSIPVIVSRYYLDKKATFQDDAGEVIVSAHAAYAQHFIVSTRKPDYSRPL